MSLALKRFLPSLYKFLKKYEKHIPATTLLWDKKKYLFNLKIVSMLSIWKSWPRLKNEANLVFDIYDGGDFIDIGAANGVYSFLFAPKAKENCFFIKCEPDINMKKSLIENLKLLSKKFNKIKIRYIFEPIGNGGFVKRHETEYGHPSYLDSSKSTETITSIKLDHLVEKLDIKPSFIKIDVEGTEYDILQGAKNVLSNYNPTIMLEKHPTLLPKNITIEKIDNFLNELNYKKEKLIFKDDIAINELWKKPN
jgi:FkbM family methyltransferase